METKEIKVTDRHEKEHTALLVICPECKGQAFNITVVHGHNHLECTGCFTVFCQAGGTCGYGKSSE